MPRTVIIAPDSFKGSLSAAEAAEAIAEGWREVRPQDALILMPQADGGEGTLDAIEASVPGAVRHEVGTVTGPDGRPTPGVWLELPGSVAVVELAQPSGLPLMATPDAVGATTRGLGEVIRHALDSGARSLVIGLGGSASTDAASGALMALGLRLTDSHGQPIADGGRALAGVASIDRSGLALPDSVTLLTDVDAPLLGKQGAAAIFGPQKGATAAQVTELDAALTHFAELFGGDHTAAGAGAAGGAGWGFATAWGATIMSGADYIADLGGLTNAIRSADLLLTGEGRFDSQSLGGKVVGQLLGTATNAGVPVGVIAGQVSIETELWTSSLTELAGSAQAAMGDPAHWLTQAGARAARELVGV
ncbi:MAG: glycerate kinase [Rhodoglobus sp.]